MAIHLASASKLELLAIAFVFYLILAGMWWLTMFWEHMWVDSLSSRGVERRLLRWQWAAFRGAYRLGRWRKPSAIGYVRIMTIIARAFILFIAVVLLFSIGARLLGPVGQVSSN